MVNINNHYGGHRKPPHFTVFRMGSGDATLSSTIRRRHGEIHQKLRALRIAVDEHFRNIKVRVELGDLKRPTSSVYRAPKYVTLLTGVVHSEVSGLRSKLTTANASGQPKDAEYQQLNRMVADLETQCRNIDLQMKTRYKEPEEIQSAPVIFPKLDSPFHTDAQFSNTSPHSDCSSKRGILKLNGSQDSLPVEVLHHKCPPINIDKPKRVTFGHGTREPQNSKRGFLFRQSSNLGYPYGSCFPALPPVPTRRRYVAEHSALEKSLRAPLKTFSNAYNFNSKREKSWLY